MNKTNTEFAMIEDLFLDCLVSDNHTMEAEVSEYPTESGATITDNIRPKNLVVTMEAIVSNTPLPEIAAIRKPIAVGQSILFGGDSGDFPPADDAYEYLVGIFKARKPVTIRTSLRTYENMVLKELGIPRSSSTGDQLRFTATFQQIQIVSANRTERVAIPVARSGKSVTKPAPEYDNFEKHVVVDRHTKTWWDKWAATPTWRYAALYLKNGTWELYRLQPETGPEATDPMISSRFTAKHPLKNLMLVAPHEYVIKG